METSQDGDGGGGGGGEGEVRQIHIVYFLSRKGVVEQPHLLNLVSTVSNIHLRDVKRWLAELRGKNMPESFAWSCKRKYKYGCYVWQDLIDEDLITPISDNEFVLKGCHISSPTSTPQDCTENEDHLSMIKEELLEEPKQEQLERKKSSEIEEESPKSTVTDDSIKSEEDPMIYEKGLKDGDDSSFSSSMYLRLFNKKPKKTTHSITMKKTKPSSSSEKSSPKSDSHGTNNGASKIFRSFVNCRDVNTKESVIVPSAYRQHKKPFNNGSDGDAVKNESAEICRINDKLLGGSQRINRKKYPWDQSQNGSRKSCDGVTETTTFCGPRTTFASYMPVSCPNCSQCGRKFKPEKLHSHMKSCKGIKASGAKGTKPAKSAEKPALSENAAEPTHNQPVPACAY